MANARGAFKFCTACKDFHPVTAFGKDRHQKDGLHIYCRRSRSRSKKENESETPEVVYNISTDYASRGSVPHTLREHFDELVAFGSEVWIETPSGYRLAWEEVD